MGLPRSEDPGFRIEIDEPVGGPAVIRVRGDLDVVTAPVLDACLAEAVLTGHSVVVDLLYVPFLGCAGLAHSMMPPTGCPSSDAV
ncbi:STAS domain-containing protein [Rhodococcus koreensis]|uniref:STAS domain-containing protein n=1 Tax=Rhodococcus koreensis TaxID=99653 RepID=UPI00367296BF